VEENPAAVLEGLWSVTPEDPGEVEGVEYTATFDGDGQLLELRGIGPDGGVAVLDTTDSTTEVDGDQVTINLPVLAGTRLFEGTLSADQNTIIGSVTEEINLGDLMLILPGGNLTFERIIENSCDDVTCDEGETCVEGNCVPVDPCDDVTCEDGESCVDGACVTDDPCADVTCEDGESCVDGECVAGDPCDGVTCEDGESCVDGECAASDPCDGVTCEDGESCVDGACVPDDPCDDVTCDDGETCVDGECVTDDPCDDVTCDDGESCVEGECVADEAEGCEALEGDAAAGEAFYADNGCAACHGDGADGGVVGPSLLDTTCATIFDKLSGNDTHVGGTVDGVTEQDAADLAAWLDSL